MEENPTFINYVVIGAVLSMIILLSKNWRRERSKQIVAVILILLLVEFLAYYNLNFSTFPSMSYLLSLALIIPFALGPLFFYYITIVYEKKFQFKRPDFLAFLPFLFSILFFTIPFTIAVQTQNESIFKYLVIVPFLGFSFFAFYIYRSFRLIKKFRVLLVNNFAYIAEKDLNWIMVWAKGLVLFLILDFLTSFFMGLEIGFKIPLLVTSLFLAGLLFYFGYHAIFQQEMSSSLLESPNMENANTAYSLRDEKEIKDLTTKLNVLFRKDLIFKENTISLKEVANKIGTTDKKLSELINSRLNSNFYEFVNDYRVEEFIERAKKRDTHKYTLLSIAFESGFNSKASFNRIFKKKMGITPSQYIKGMREIEKPIGLNASDKSI